MERGGLIFLGSCKINAAPNFVICRRHFQFPHPPSKNIFLPSLPPRADDATLGWESAVAGASMSRYSDNLWFEAYVARISRTKLIS